MQGEGWQGAPHLEVSESVNEKSFEAWLKALPEERRYEWAVTLATRAAQRVFSFWTEVMPDDWARKRDLTVLPLLRSILISVVAVKRPTTDIKDAANASALAASAVAYAASADAKAYSAYAAANADPVTSAAVDATYAASASALAASLNVSVNDTAANAAGLAASASAVLWEGLRKDIHALEQNEDIRTHPLWPDAMPPKIGKAWAKGRAWMENAPGHAFWIRWYEAILAGKPLTQDWDSHWQLMHDIALIPDEEWGEGKEQDAIRVAGIIDLITQKHALQHEVARAKRAIENELFNEETLGQHRDNLPDDMPQFAVLEYRKALRELQTELDAVEEALQPPIPDAALLEEVSGRLSAAWERLKTTARAIGVGVVAGVTTYVSAAIGQAGVRGMDWLLDHGMPQLIRGLKDTAPKPSAPPKASKGWEKPSVDT